MLNGGGEQHDESGWNDDNVATPANIINIDNQQIPLVGVLTVKQSILYSKKILL
jgi:hypothetical protein